MAQDVHTNKELGCQIVLVVEVERFLDQQML